MEFEALAPDGPVLLKPVLHGDERGYFMETFRQNEFEAHCGSYTFVQDNQSRSGRHVLRGLHYQLRQPQGKLVRVISGSVFDVAVDLRRSSPNFGCAYGVPLDAASHQMFWVPPGFAHGFLVTGDGAEFIYKCTDYYAPGDEHCLLWNEQSLGVEWPLNGIEPVLSAKDKLGLQLGQCAVYE